MNKVKLYKIFAIADQKQIKELCEQIVEEYDNE